MPRGLHAPGVTDREATFKTIHHINLSHGKAIAALRADNKDLILGIVNNLGPAVPASGSEADKKAAQYADAIWNRAFADPQFLGRYPALLESDLAPYMKPDDLATIHQPLEFFRGQPLFTQLHQARPKCGARLFEPTPASRHAGDRYGMGDQSPGFS